MSASSAAPGYPSGMWSSVGGSLLRTTSSRRGGILSRDACHDFLRVLGDSQHGTTTDKPANDYQVGVSRGHGQTTVKKAV